MQISNFREYSRKSGRYVAKVDITERKGLFRHHLVTRTEDVARERFELFWFFVSTGALCPGYQVNDLEKSYRAKNNLQVPLGEV